jgi:hypothetical protein
MRKFGYILFIVGFIWVTFIAVTVGAVAHAMRDRHDDRLSQQQSYTRQDVAITYQEAAFGVADFAQSSLVGCLLICIGAITILSTSGKRDSDIRRPPVL